MYLKFFGLKEKPFELTPDPKFLFLTPGHREALAQLIYGVSQQKGFILLSGEVGTGKTTLLRTLLHRLDGQIDFAFIMNSTLPFDEMLEYTLADFGVADPRGTRAQRLIVLNHFLLGEARARRKPVLIIDEAQNLDIQTLEQIRLLSNFETDSEKLIQIVLAGQPELHGKLQLPQLRQLKQRIGLRCVLVPMSQDEIGQYIANHLRVAGGRDRQLFTSAAIRRIGQYSGGVPRVVNMVCDHCLLIAYADQAREVDVDIARRAIEYLEEGESSRTWWRPRTTGRSVPERTSKRALGGWLTRALAAAAATAGVVSLSAYRSELSAVSATVIASVGAIMRWLAHWWGS